MGARCLWCLRSDGGAAKAASSPSVERPTSVRMSVRMVTRFVYVLRVAACWRCRACCGALFGFTCLRVVCCSRSAKGRGRARRVASRVGRLHRSQRESSLRAET